MVTEWDWRSNVSAAVTGALALCLGLFLVWRAAAPPVPPASAIALRPEPPAAPAAPAPAPAPTAPEADLAPPRLAPTPPPPRLAQADPGPSLDERLAMAGTARGAPAFIRVFKESRELELWLQAGERFVLAKVYPICAYSGRLGPKLRQGDHQAPEGFYAVSQGSLNPNSAFHLSFNLGYPNAYDRAHGRTGDFLMVHGSCVSAGCYAMTNPGIEEIYGLVEAALKGGQPYFRAHLFPFRLTEAALARRRKSPWAGFWRNLKEGYDHFERDRAPPDARVENGVYVFTPGG